MGFSSYFPKAASKCASRIHDFCSCSRMIGVFAITKSALIFTFRQWVVTGGGLLHAVLSLRLFRDDRAFR